MELCIIQHLCIAEDQLGAEQQHLQRLLADTQTYGACTHQHYSSLRSSTMMFLYAFVQKKSKVKHKRKRKRLDPALQPKQQRATANPDLRVKQSQQHCHRRRGRPAVPKLHQKPKSKLAQLPQSLKTPVMMRTRSQTTSNHQITARQVCYSSMTSIVLLLYISAGSVYASRHQTMIDMQVNKGAAAFLNQQHQVQKKNGRYFAQTPCMLVIACKACFGV